MSELQILKNKIDQCMARDQFRLSKMLQRVLTSTEFEKAAAAVEKSLLETERRRSLIPAISYPDLPVSAQREHILQTIKNNQVVIIAGETGSGKTTQIPKICLELGRGISGWIGHTQPRRLAARAVSNRLAEELGVKLGDQVGFKVRFSDNVSDSSLIKLMTDGVLLAELQSDRFLTRYDTIIVDEAHERSLNIDFLLGYFKQLLPKRKDLKLIVTSATIDHSRFSKHFSDAPIIEVSGRTYPVDILYRPLTPPDDKQDAFAVDALEKGVLDAVQECIEIQRKDGVSRPGDILVFLPGEREIRDISLVLKKFGPPNTEVLPLYARLSNAEQNRIFASHNGRRVILSTNVAETSLTVPNIGYVIDSGIARISRYSHRTRVQRLPIEPISKASANQRSGRCGRIGPGVCIRLCDEQEFSLRPAFTDPEILRTNLAAVILQMTFLRLGRPDQFPFIDAPDSRLVSDGYRTLEELGAYNDKGLTEIGKQLAPLPVDPRLGRMLLAAQSMGCVSEILIIISAMSIQDPRERPQERQQAANQAHAQFIDEQSDFLSYVKLWHWIEQQWQDLSDSQLRKLLKKSFLSYVRVREWRETHRQLKLFSQEMNIRENIEPADYKSVHSAILTGLLSYIGSKSDERDYLGTRNRRFQLFPGSALFKKQPKWLVAGEIVETQKTYARMIAKIEPEWIEPIAGHLLKRNHFEPHWEKSRGQVVAYEQTSLFGLIINQRKRVSFERIDPDQSRKIFIQHALVTGQMVTVPKSIQHNLKLVESIQYLETKARRHDILVDDSQIEAFYDEKVPASICNVADFEKWRRDAEQKNPDCLLLKEELLKRKADVPTQMDFPDKLAMASAKLNLSYKHNAQDQADGVSVDVPIALLPQMNDAQLEWMVPGLVREKCVQLIKSLPKNLRKHFVPVPDFVDAFLRTDPVKDKSLRVQLAEYLRQRSGIKIQEDQFDDEDLDSFLRFNIRVYDEQGHTLDQSRDLKKLKQNLSSSIKSSFDSLVSQHEDVIETKQWAWEVLPKQKSLNKNGAQLIVYPACLDAKETVRLEWQDDPAHAEWLHRRGVKRLAYFELGASVKLLRKNINNFNRLALLFGTFGNNEQLEEGLILWAIDKEIIGGQPLPRDKESFLRIIKQGRGELAARVGKNSDLLQEVLLNAAKLKPMLASKQNAFPWLYQDMTRQLNALFEEDWLVNTYYEQLESYARYLKAMLYRVEKAADNPVRDKEYSTVIADWSQRLKAKNCKMNFALEQFRWMIEEYRIALFAQHIKTIHSVSEKRMQKAWECLP